MFFSCFKYFILVLSLCATLRGSVDSSISKDFVMVQRGAVRLNPMSKKRVQAKLDEKMAFLETFGKKRQTAPGPGRQTRPDKRCRSPEDSSFRRTVLAVHGVHVDDDSRNKFAILDKYRPYFLDMFYIQMRGSGVSKTSFFLPDGSQQLNLSSHEQRTFNCGDHYRFRTKPEWWTDENSYACMAELMAIVLSRAQRLYGTEPSGFLFLHADFWITPRFLTNKDTEALWMAGGPRQFELPKSTLSVTRPKKVMEVENRNWGCITLADAATQEIETWEPYQSAAVQAVASYESGEKLRTDQICKGWADMYFIPQSVFKMWIAIMRRFYTYKLSIEFAVPTARSMLATVVPTSSINGIVGSCCFDNLGLADIDNEANDAGHKVDLRDSDIRRRMGDIFDCR